MEWLTPKLVESIYEVAEKGGLALTLTLVLIGYVFEVRRSIAKDKIIAAQDKASREFQEKILTAIGEMKTSVSNGNLLLDMLTRGRK